MESGNSQTTPPTTAQTEGGNATRLNRVPVDESASRDVMGAQNEEPSGKDSNESSSASAALGDVSSLTESECAFETESAIKNKNVESQHTKPRDGDLGKPKQDSEILKRLPDEKLKYPDNTVSDQTRTPSFTPDAAVGNPNRNQTGNDIHALTENLKTSFGDNFGMFKCPFSDQDFRALGEKSERGMTHGSSSPSGTTSNTSGIPPPETCIETNQQTFSEMSMIRAGSHDLTENKVAADSTSERDGRDLGGDIVVVTGGNGFFGQHIVKMLQLRAPHVSEIWVLDIKPFQQKLDYQPTKKVKSIIGSVTDAKFVAYSLRGATSVIHVAGIMSWGTFPDLDGMEKVNVKGTVNVLNACLKNNIKRLIYCSTVDVAIGSQPIRGGDETNTHVPDKFLFPGYPDTKYHGERIILGCGRPKREDGGQLQTSILRANVCYGELDEEYVTNALRMAKQNKGILYQVGDGSAMFQQAYVGNTAWAFVCADSAMRENPNLSNEIFYIPDNTPVQNSFNFIRPYLEVRGFYLSSRPINFPLLHRAVSLAEVFVKGLSPLVRLSLPFQSYTLAYINTDLYFNGSKARRVLNFEPIYSPNEARVASMKYYTTVDLEGGPTT